MVKNVVARNDWSLHQHGANDYRSYPVVSTANQIFALEFSGNDWLYKTEATAHPGGGWAYLLGSGGVEPNGTNMAVVDIDDPLFPGTQKGFRDTYYASGEGKASSNHTLWNEFPERAKVYVRFRLRFRSVWVFGNDQLKFCKIRGDSQVAHVSNNMWFNGNGEFMATGAQNYYLFAHKYTANSTHLGDDINNGFGPGGTDANWVPNIDQWYWVEFELDAVAPNSPAGRIRQWIDGQLYMDISNINLSSNVADVLYSMNEFGGLVWQNDASGIELPPADIALEFHALAVFDQYPGPPPGVV